MAQTVGTHGVAVFTSPSNGDTLDATVVKGNDNNLRSAYVDHDADGGLHVQSSSLATRSSPGLLGRKWLTTDVGSYRLFFDDGSAWYELSYLSTNGGTVTGNMTVTGTLTASVTGPVTGNASTATALQTARNINGVAFNGTADITVTAAAGTLSGSTLNSGVTASSLTSVGTLSSLTVSGNLTVDTDTLVVDSANNRVGVGIAAPAYPFQVRRAGGAGSLGISIDTVGGTDRAVQYFAVQDSATGAGSGHAFYYRPQGTTTDTLGFMLDELGNLAVDTNTLFVDAANNAVGIGTTTPVASYLSKFAVEGNIAAAFGGKLYQFDATNSTGRYIQALPNSEFSIGKYQAGGDIEQVRITGSGNFAVDTNTLFVDATNNRVGVGTATPIAPLHVAGNAKVGTGAASNSQVMMVNTPSGSAAGLQLFQDANESWVISNPASSTALTFANSSVERMRLDATGNLGLGVVPSAWTTIQSGAIQTGGAGAIWSTGVTDVFLSQNTFFNGSYRYISTNASSAYRQLAGAHQWFSAASGTAGAAISFTQAMTLDASGQLGIGTASPTRRLSVIGSAVPTYINVGSGDNTSLVGLLLGGTTNPSNGQVLYDNTGNSMRLLTSGIERARIDASGNLGLGVTPSAFASGAKAFQIGSYSALFESVVGRTTLSFNTRESGSGLFTYLQTEFATRYQQVSGVHSWFTAPSGTAGAAISFTQAMTLDASGNLLVGTASAGYGLAGRGLVEVNGSSSSLLGLKVGDVAKGYIQHTGTDLTLANQAAGSISFVTNNVSRWGMNSSGHLLAATDATYDIGASGATRPRDMFLSGKAVYGTAATRLQVGSADGAVGGIYGNATGEIVVAVDAFRAFNKAASAERMRVDNTTTAGQTALMLWDVDNGTLERVTVGAADSGGAGFKVLRIPN